MPTDEYESLLDREEAIGRAQPLAEKICPLLREVVNHGSMVFRRCTTASDNLTGENVDVAPLVLYRQIIELTDTIEVLFGASCIDGAIPSLRVAFEASMSLDYIMQADYERRSLAWLCAHTHRRIAGHRRLDARTAAGQEVGVAWERDLVGVSPIVSSVIHDSVVPVRQLENVLARSQMAPIEAEYQRLAARKRWRPPEWSEFFGGPKNRRELAKTIGREIEYSGSLRCLVRLSPRSRRSSNAL